MSSEKKQPVKIVLSELKEKVQNGAKRKALAEYYGISEVQMAKALKSAGLKIRNFHAPAFEIVDDAEVHSEDADVKEHEEGIPPYNLFAEEVEEVPTQVGGYFNSPLNY